MIKYEDYRNDKNFKIDSLTYKEIFLNLKPALENVIANFEKLEKLEDLTCVEIGSTIRYAYGKDKDLYPLITLELKSSSQNWLIGKYYYCEINPFEINVKVNHYGEVKVVDTVELTKALIDLMCEQFPNSDYLEKREKYFKNAEIIRKTEANMLNF